VQQQLVASGLPSSLPGHSALLGDGVQSFVLAPTRQCATSAGLRQQSVAQHVLSPSARQSAQSQSQELRFVSGPASFASSQHVSPPTTDESALSAADSVARICVRQNASTHATHHGTSVPSITSLSELSPDFIDALADVVRYRLGMESAQSFDGSVDRSDEDWCQVSHVGFSS
jgi:hypothetical protein